MTRPRLPKFLALISALSFTQLLGCGDYFGTVEIPNIKPSISGNQPADLNVELSFNKCAAIRFVLMAPTDMKIGQSGSLLSQASDPEGDTIAYTWTATNGEVADPTAPVTSYTCTEPGDHIVVLSVADASCITSSEIISVKCSN